VVSPFTSAWALASFAGSPAAPNAGFGSLHSGRSHRGFGCGGAHGSGHSHLFTSVTIEQLVQQALDGCPDAKAGTLVFETTDEEIVDVVTDDGCIREQMWALDVSPISTSGRRLITVEHAAGMLDTLNQTALGYRDLTMPTPNITTNTASGMK
jgi:hypothetical protein